MYVARLAFCCIQLKIGIKRKVDGVIHKQCYDNRS